MSKASLHLFIKVSNPDLFSSQLDRVNEKQSGISTGDQESGISRGLGFRP